MCYGASAAGVRTMTSSSSPGISLKLEGISYLAGADLPCVIINVMRGGPGLGNIAPAQGDYFQATKGGGHGDYRLIVLAPSTVQESAELVGLAFDLSDRYRVPAMLLADGMLGQMMEPVALPPTGTRRPFLQGPGPSPGPRAGAPLHRELRPRPQGPPGAQPPPPRAVPGDRRSGGPLGGGGDRGRRGPRRGLRDDGADRQDRGPAGAGEGLRVGLLRPITLWPFPYEPIRALAERVRAVLTVELSAGQMWEDVRLAVEGRCPTPFYGEMGGVVPTPDEVLQEVKRLA